MSVDRRQAPLPPIAIRVTRPYATEDELLAHEADTLARTSVTLLGAQPRPQGVVLRFELALSSGSAVLRGEGRVVAYKPNAHDGLGGLTLRFTRLDSRSKSLVDKATALREQRRQAMPSPAGSFPPPSSSAGGLLPSVSPPSSSSLLSVPSSPPSSTSDISIAVEIADASGPSLPLVPSSALDEPDPTSVPQPRSRLRPTAVAPLEPPADRDVLLSRLRSRARGLDAAQVARILERK